MISIEISGHRFQLRAAAVVTHDGFVLLHRREGDDYWALPGGRVELGEDARSAVAREMAEEPTRTDSVLIRGFYDLHHVWQHEKHCRI